MWKCLFFLISLALIASLLVSCGSDSSGQSASRMERAIAEVEAQEAEEVGVTGEILFEAHWTKTFSFTANSDTSSRPGKLKIRFTNPQKMPQDIAFEDPHGRVIAKTEPIVGGTTTAVAVFKPGVYHFFSSVGDSREKGMEGTLTVAR